MRIILPCLLVMIVSCNQASSTNSAASNETNVSTDSLLNVWNKAWNNRDSAAIASQFADDAVMLSAAKTMNGKSEIVGRFVSHYYKSMLNLQTQKVYESAAGDLAVQAGTYTHQIQGTDSTQKTLSGDFTFVWKQQADKSWKLRFLEME